jgi:hypothetical protein
VFRNQASENVYYLAKQKKDKLGRPMWVDVTDEDVERATAALAYAHEVLGAKVEDRKANDFEHNLYVAAKNSIVTEKTQGTLAYLPVAFAKYQEKEIEQAARKQAINQEFVGVVKQRLSLTLKVMSVFEAEECGLSPVCRV